MFPVLALCLVASSNFASVMSSSLTVPRSSVVLISGRVEMKCSVTGSDSPLWTYTAWNGSTMINIYLYGQIVVSMRSRYKVDKNISEQHNLIIDSVDFTYAGRYRCIDAIQETLWTDIQLTVLGADPVCAANISVAQDDGKVQRHLHLFSWCSINYTGNGFPVFIWTKSNADKNIAADTTTSGREPVTNTSSIIEQLHFSDGGVTLQCQITFQIPNNSESVYIYTWNYTLPYGPRIIGIVEHADRLECLADGYPTPTYRWTNVETNRSKDGPIYILNRTNDNEHTFECTATNILYAESKNYTIKGWTPSASDFFITAFAIGGSIPLLLITAIIILYAVHRKRLKDDSSDRPDVALNTDLPLYDDIVLSSETSPNYILKGDHLPGRSDSRTISDNPVYAEVMKPKGPSKGSKGGNICDNSRPPQTPNREKKIVIGVDGTECAEQSEVKPPAHKGDVPQPPVFSQLEIYASIDRSGKVPAPPLLPKL